MSRSQLEEKIINVLCEKGPLTFNELYEMLREQLEVSKTEAREALASLVRSGRVKREPSHERARLVFRAEQCPQGRG